MKAITESLAKYIHNRIISQPQIQNVKNMAAAGNAPQNSEQENIRVKTSRKLTVGFKAKKNVESISRKKLLSISMFGKEPLCHRTGCNYFEKDRISNIQTEL